MKGDRQGPQIYSWVDQPHITRGTPGGHSRPWSIRERLVTKAIGDEVRRLREQQGWTVSQLAARLCISQAHLTYLENAQRAVWMPLLWDLADIFQLTPTHFVSLADRKIARYEEDVL